MKQLYNKIVLLGLLLSLLASTAIAQTRITGRVTDKTNTDALIGATVLEKGTSNGTITDIDGKFALNVASLNAIAKQLKPEQVEATFFPLLKRLSAGTYFTSRSSACALFATVYTSGNADTKNFCLEYVQHTNFTY